jgi:hypothetical protein
MSSPEIVFALAPGQNRFFRELAEALSSELKALGARARISDGGLPPLRAGEVTVLMPPHEFVFLSQVKPAPDALARCVMVTAEQPSTSFFASNLELAQHAGAVLDINERSIRAYRAGGVPAEHLQLGYSPAWDRRGGAPERDIDVLFMGRATARREVLLAGFADTLERFEFRVILSDNRVAASAEGPDFVAGENKLNLLARTKVLLNIHGEGEPYFEWLRVSEAMSNGCAIVTEHSTDIAPLRPGVDVLSGRGESLGLLAAALVDDDEARAEMVRSAESRLRQQVNLATGAAALLAAAQRVAQTPIAESAARATRIAGSLISLRSRHAGQGPAPAPTPPTEQQRALRGLKQLHRELQAMRRRFDAEALARERPDSPQPRTVEVATTRGWSALPRPRVSVIVPLYNDEDVVLDALDSVARSTMGSWEIVVVDDASRDGSPQRVRAWMEENDEKRCAMVHHEVNRGLSIARNTGIACSRAELLLMLDSDNMTRRFGIARLVAALDDDHTASFSYGLLDRFSHEEPIDVVSKFGWEPARFRDGNYIDALAMFRRTALDHVGGYSDDPRLALGLEDYDLWVRLAERGHHGAFTRQFVGSYRVGHSSMLSVTGISSTDAVAAIVEHAPTLMGGIVLPP